MFRTFSSHAWIRVSTRVYPWDFSTYEPPETVLTIMARRIPRQTKSTFPPDASTTMYPLDVSWPSASNVNAEGSLE
jgi:hypothetical protein